MPAELTGDQHRELAVALFNHVWTLLGRERSPEGDDEMIHAAHASRHHWGEVGTGANLARGEWQVSRVYAILGRGEPALHHARRCLAYCDAHPGDLEDWDLPYAYEALARAYAVTGERVEAERAAARALELGERISDPEDKELLDRDLATL
jgi:hypothetical protein